MFLGNQLKAFSETPSLIIQKSVFLGLDSDSTIYVMVGKLT